METHWVMDDLSTSSDDDYHQENLESLPQPTAAPVLPQQFNQNTWTVEGHDSVRPLSYHDYYDNSISWDQQAFPNDVTYTCGENIDNVWNWNSLVQTPSTCDRENFNSGPCDGNSTVNTSASANTSATVNTSASANASAGASASANASAGVTTSASAGAGAGASAESTNDNCVVENEGCTYIETRENSPRPPPPTRTPPLLINNNNNYYRGQFSVETKHNRLTNKYYVDIEAIFKYITLGKRISDEYYDFVNNYVCNIVNGCNVDDLPENNKFTEEVYSFHGRKFNKVIVMYNIGEFHIVSHSLLTWAIQNPEKIS